MTTPHVFRYLHGPESCWREDDAKPCGACGQPRPGYWFVRIHDDGYDEHHVCEPCLIAGRLAERGLPVNEGDPDGLREQLRRTRPEMSEDECATVAAARTAELAWRTPQPKVLNGFTWPTHCGDYAVFFRRVDADDVSRLAPDGDGRAFLASHLLGGVPDGPFLGDVWAERLKGFWRFYLWRCGQCGEYLITYDCD